MAQLVWDYAREDMLLLSRCNDVALESQCLRNKAASAKQKTADWIGSSEPTDQRNSPGVLRKERRTQRTLRTILIIFETVGMMAK